MGSPRELVCYLALLLGAAVATSAVPRYDIHELVVVNSHLYTNPFDFREIELVAVFASPTGKRIRAFGFYDGDGRGNQNGPLWKVRFMPDEVGTWTYTYSWSGAGMKPSGGSGAFTAESSQLQGPLRLDPEHDHHIVRARGAPFYWNGDTEWNFLSDSFTQEQRFAAIDFLASKSVNNLLMTLVNDDTYDVYPWVSPTQRTRFDLAKLARWERVVERMADRDMVADLWFFADDSKQLLPAASSSEEDSLFAYLIARFSAYWNVTWCLALEYDEYRSAAWVIDRAQFVKDRDPFDHLLTVHQRPRLTYDFPGEPNLDRTALQRLGATPALLNQSILEVRKATSAAGFPIPVMNEEFYIEGVTGSVFRQQIWAIAMGGGYARSASLGWWIGTHYTHAQHFDEAKRLYDFMTRFPWYTLAPSNDLVDAGFALGRRDDRYIVYLPNGGPVDVDLGGANGGFVAEWYDPRSGGIVPGPSVSGGAVRRFIPPDASDWVLHLHKASAPPPPPPPPPSAPPPTGNTTPCVRTPQTACLLQNRFEVKVAMKNFASPPIIFPGVVQLYQGASSETNQSVSFYSFKKGNVEVFVKMVDACDVASDAFWLFAAGATNAETHVVVRDSHTGVIRTIDNPSGQLFMPVANTQAFKTCEQGG